MWFRLYAEVLYDPKVQRLDCETFKTWINLLCLASARQKDGVLPPLADIAFALRVDEATAQRVCDTLETAGLLDRTPADEYEMHNWRGRQFISDSSNERVKKYRDRMRENGDTLTGYTKHRAAVYARDGHACVYCGSSETLCLDHLVPVQRGGDHDPTNLVTACKGCNSGKAGRLPEEAGYAFVAEHVAALYAATRARLLGDAPVTVTGVTVTPPVTVAVTPTEQIRAETETETDQSRVLAIASVAPADAGRSIVRFTTTDESAPDAAQATPKRARKKREPGASVLTQAQRAEFDRWWPTYPREKRGSRKLAEEQWARKNPDGARTDAIISSTEQHKQGRKFQDGYAWEAFRFLRDEHWLDEVEPVRATPAATGGAPKPIRVMSDRSRENLRLLLAAEQVEIRR